MHSDIQRDWEEYRARELAALRPLLAELGFELEEEQPHTGGERYLMQAVTTAHGKKLVLIGRRTKDGKKVVIKATSDPAGIRELEFARESRRVLHRINFAYRVFRSPEEILFVKRGAHAISIHEFVVQEQGFLARPLAEQFALALKAFKAQEGAHATTYGHQRLIKKSFDRAASRDYIDSFRMFAASINAKVSDPELQRLLERGEALLAEHRETIERYCGFLTHTDFVPHNFRIVGDDIYLLDHSSLRFGNKYEGWARFLNYMALYNPRLELALSEYVRANRTPEESEALKLMRIYRLGEIIWYYADKSEKSAGDLQILNRERIRFWTRVLEAVLNDAPLSAEVLESYTRLRDALRSPEELRRQEALR